MPTEPTPDSPQDSKLSNGRKASEEPPLFDTEEDLTPAQGMQHLKQDDQEAIADLFSQISFDDSAAIRPDDSAAIDIPKGQIPDDDDGIIFTAEEPIGMNASVGPAPKLKFGLLSDDDAAKDYAISKAAADAEPESSAAVPEHPKTEPRPLSGLSSTRNIKKISYPLIQDSLVRKGLLVWTDPRKGYQEHGEKEQWAPYVQTALQLGKNLEDKLSEQERAAPLKVFLFGLENDVLYCAQSGYKSVALPNGSIKHAAFVPTDVSFESVYALVDKDDQLLGDLARMMADVSNLVAAEKVYHRIIEAPAQKITIANPRPILEQIVGERTVEPTVIVEQKDATDGLEKTNVNESSVSGGSGGHSSTVDKLVGRLEGYEITVADFENLIMRTDRMFGNYKLLGVLGKGGQGIVYKAIDETTRQIYALKILLKTGDLDKESQKTTDPDTNLTKIEYTNGVGSARSFYREARILAELASKDDHITRISPLVHMQQPAIVTKKVRIIEDKKVKEEFTEKYEKEVTIPAMPMEFQEEGSLAGKIKARASGEITKDWRDYAVDLTMTLAETLGVVHSRGIIHKDIKPDNILIKVRNRRERPVLTDFGLAKEVGEVDSIDGAVADSATTEFSNVAGTPAYMAPEQISGVKATKQADVYGLGATLYELLTNRRPHGHEAGLREILLSFENSKSTAFHCELIEPGSVISKDLAAIVKKCLEVDLNHRYRSMDELYTDLDDYRKGKPVRAMEGKYSIRKRLNFAVKAAWEKKATKIAAGLLFTSLAASAGYVAISAKVDKANRIAEKREAFLTEDTNAKARFEAASAVSDPKSLSEAIAAYDKTITAARTYFDEQGLPTDRSSNPQLELLMTRADDLRTRGARAQEAARLNTIRSDLERRLTAARERYTAANTNATLIPSAIESYTAVKAMVESLSADDNKSSFAQDAYRSATLNITELNNRQEQLRTTQEQERKLTEARTNASREQERGETARRNFDYEGASAALAAAVSLTPESDLDLKASREGIRQEIAQEKEQARTSRFRQYSADISDYVALITELFTKKATNLYVDDTGKFGNDDAGFDRRMEFERDHLRRLMRDPRERLYERLQVICDEKVSDYDDALKNSIRSLIADKNARVSTYNPAIVSQIRAIDAQAGDLIDKMAGDESWTVIRLDTSTINALMQDVRHQEELARDRAQRFASRPELVESREREGRRHLFEENRDALSRSYMGGSLSDEEYSRRRAELRTNFYGAHK